MKLRAKMMMISLLPVFLLGTGIFILAADRMANGIYQESYDGMHAAALAVRDIFEIGGEGAYRMDAGGDLWKGEALNISKSFGIVDHIKETTGMDVTIFWGDARVLTSIHDEAGERQAGTTAPKEAKDSVLGRGEPLMTRDVEILGTEYVACYVPFFQDGDEGGDPAGMIFLGNPRERVSVIINEVRLQMLLAVLFVLAVTGVVVTCLVNRVLGALFQGMGLLKKISEGDLRARDDERLLKRSDEIGLLGKEICTLRGQLLEMIGALCEKSGRLDFEAQAMRQRSKNILLSMKGIDSSVQEMSESCAEQARDASSAGGSMTDMGEMIGGSNLEIHKMHEVSTQIQIVSERAMDKILALREEMKQVGTAIGYLGRQTRLTKESADKISSAAELIAAVASQTSLLSLNASIEAARAGEAGKGFGVVASEIQKLSVQADEAVEDIRSMTENLIQNSDHTMERMEEVKEIIGSQSQTAEQAGKAFESVWNRIQESAGCMNVVSKKAAEIEEVRMNIVSAAQNSAALSQENAAAIEEIMAALSESCEEIHILSEEADALEELSAQMKQIVGAFRN